MFDEADPIVEDLRSFTEATDIRYDNIADATYNAYKYIIKKNAEYLDEDIVRKFSKIILYQEC